MSLSTRLARPVPASLLLAAWALSASGCQQAPEERDLSSLRRSGDATFVCIGPDREGAPLSYCPQGGRASDLGLTVGNEGYTLHSLVTQTLSAEVAVVRVASPANGGNSRGKVLDVDSSNPGVTPLRVGEKPTDIVTTPGGHASFVGVAQVGLQGIYALPTSCVLSPLEGEPRRDRTSWPACSLSSAPGDMVVVVDSTQVDGEPRQFCGAGPSDDLPRVTEDTVCTADLSSEAVQPGARKLVVALPTEGKIVVLDAQEVLDRQPGTYEPCHIEAELELKAEVPEEIFQPLPAELSDGSDSTWLTYQGLAGPHTPVPSSMVRSGSQILIADRGAPVIHRLDVSDVCAPEESAPLLATSFEEPTRVVTTSQLAVSPLSPTGAQYVYAVDEVGDGKPNILIFDISAGAASRAPLMRPGSALVPSEAPDRIEFATGVKDVGFALLDRSIADPVTGVAAAGALCDPDPDTPSTDQGALYRPSSSSAGAGPLIFRGLFGYALLSNGGMAVIDIEDFDAACRRPKAANSSSEMDFRGCANDDIADDFFTVDGQESSLATVTEEVSCRMVVPHRARSRRTMESSESSGVRAPSLRSFGALSRHDRSIGISRLTVEGKKHPIVLAADFEFPQGEAVPVELQIGSEIHSADSVANPLQLDPNFAERTMVSLPSMEPRAYPPSEVLSIVYEGQIDRTHRTGELTSVDTDASRALLTDPNVNFCSLGLQDRNLTAQVGERQFGLSDGASERFVERHTDYVQLVNRLLHEDDQYWDTAGESCGETAIGVSGQGYDFCASVFGQGDQDELLTSRDLTVVRAERGQLTVTPREDEGLSPEEHMAALQCCFPSAKSYRARAGHQWVVRGSVTGFQHPVVVDTEGGTDRCVFDTTPLTENLRGRAFEVSSTVCENDDPEDEDSCGVGVRTDDDVVCSYDATRGPVAVGGPASDCIFSDLNRRFVVYRGLEPTERNMGFGYEVIGGFESQVISLVQNSNIVLPVSMVPVPTFGAFGVVDSQNRGLMIVDLVNAHVAQSFF